MKDFKQFVQKTKNKLKRNLNEISGKIKIRSYVIILVALTTILCVRMVFPLKISFVKS